MTPDAFVDPEVLLDIAWQASLVLAALIALLVFQIMAQGWVLDRRRRHDESLVARWEPILADAVTERPAALPPLARRDAMTFLQLWNHVQGIVLDEATERLNDVARRTGAAAVARRALRSRRGRDRLIALTAIGHLADEQAWTDLESIAASDDPVRSLVAVKALFRIDPVRAAPRLIPEIGRRPEWSLSALAGILSQTGPDLVSRPLADAALAAPPDQAPRLIRLLDLAHPSVAVFAVRRILGSATDTEVVTACLRVFADPERLDTVRAFLGDERWQVRLQAVSALGRMGTPEDEPRLVAALEDREWWVRYRAARGLADMPPDGRERLERLAREVPGRFARDILRQVMAEQELPC